MSVRSRYLSQFQIASHAKRFLAFALYLSAAIGDGLPAEAKDPPPASPSKSEQKNANIDQRSPLPPAGGVNLALAEKLRIQNPDRAIFAGRKDVQGNPIPGSGIVDFEEVASQEKNWDEYTAWHEVVQHAKSFPSSEIEEVARRDLTPDDLIGLGSPPRIYRLSIIRFDGRIVRVRRIAASKSLQEAGTREIYEALLVPYDEPPSDTVSFVFTELPEALAAVANTPEEKWLDVNLDAIAAGYFFKVKQDPHQTEKTPILIGKSVTPSRDPASLASDDPARLKNNPVPLDRNLQVFKFIKDDARISKGDDNWQEAVAWNRVLLHARRFSPEELEANARTDVKFADLFESVRKDYQLQLIKFEGRLLMVRKMEASRKLRSAGIDAAYEGWLVPQDEPRGNPVCIVFTDMPDGIEFGRVNKWVSFAGYSFKLLRYDSGERDKDDPNKNVTKRAPLLLGRAILAERDPDAPSAISWSAFVQIALISILGLAGSALALAWWFRKGDTRAKQEINAHRARNPFAT